MKSPTLIYGQTKRNLKYEQLTELSKVKEIGKKLENGLECESVAVRYLQTSKIIAIFDDRNNEVKYAIEVKENKVLQFKGLRNSNPNQEDKSLIEGELLQKWGIISNVDLIF
jgi:hypothetical protein